MKVRVIAEDNIIICNMMMTIYLAPEDLAIAISSTAILGVCHHRHHHHHRHHRHHRHHHNTGLRQPRGRLVRGGRSHSMCVERGEVSFQHFVERGAISCRHLLSLFASLKPLVPVFHPSSRVKNLDRCKSTSSQPQGAFGNTRRGMVRDALWKG